jgi:predicted  nucleic acid-binding Zn-ribbon protein
LKLQ